jgi:hypothetical protein
MPDIFMSYAHADQPIARAVAVELQGRGGSLRSHSMEKCEYFLLVYSPRAALSPRIRAETAAAILAGKQLCTLIVEHAPLNDFLFLLNTPIFELTQPDDTQNAVNGLARLFGLPEGEMSPVDITVFTPQSPDDEDGQSPSLSPEEQENIFLTACERARTRSAEAMFLYRYLEGVAPDYADGTIHRFAEQINQTLRTHWLTELEKEANRSLSNRDWEAVNNLIERIAAVDPQSELVGRLRNSVIDGQLAVLYESVQARAKSDGWRSVEDLLAQMQALKADDARVLEIGDRIQQEESCAAVYKEAVKARAKDRTGAVITLLEYINQHCPDYGDPEGLLSGSAIRPEYVNHLQPIATLSQHMGAVHTLSFSPDGMTLVSGGGDGTLRLWDMEAMQQVAVKRIEDTAVKGLSFSQDGMFLVSTSAGRIVYLWSMPEGREAVVMDDFKADVVSALFTPNASALIIGYQTGGVEVVRIEDGLILSDMPAHEHGISQMLLSPDGTRLITASEDRLVKLWTFIAPDTIEHPPLKIFTGHKMLVNDAALSHDHRMIASASNDGTVVIWEVETGKAKFKVLHENGAQVRAVAFSPHAPILASGGVDRLIRLWDVETGKELATLDAHAGSVNTLAFSPDGTRLASGSSDRTIRLWGFKQVQ